MRKGHSIYISNKKMSPFFSLNKCIILKKPPISLCSRNHVKGSQWKGKWYAWAPLYPQGRLWRYLTWGTIYISGPQPFWHQGPVSWKTIFPRNRGWGGDGSGGNASDGEWWGAADEASLTRSPLTSCCAARFLTGQGPLQVCSLEVGDPWFTW